MADVDNLSPCKDVRNFIIGPVYAHSEHLDLSKAANPVLFDRQKPIGMIQLVNKTNFGTISEYDLRKFKAIQHLIGLSIDQVSEIHNFINIRIDVAESIDNIETMVKDQMTMSRKFTE